MNTSLKLVQIESIDFLNPASRHRLRAAKRKWNMMNIGNGKRDEWEFEYTASKLAEGAAAQKVFRLGRVAVWTAAKEKLMAEIKDGGIEITESVSAGMGSYGASTQSFGPQVGINPGYQKKLAECHLKIESHQQAAAEYDGWVQVLNANSETRHKLTQADWLYFFGRA